MHPKSLRDAFSQPLKNSSESEIDRSRRRRSCFSDSEVGWRFSPTHSTHPASRVRFWFGEGSFLFSSDVDVQSASRAVWIS